MALPEYEKTVNDLKKIEDCKKYSFEETFTGEYWVDGKPIYRKVIDFGSLPNATAKTINHGILNLDWLTDIKINGYRETDGRFYPIPFNSVSNLGYGISLEITKTEIIIATGTVDRTNVTAYIILKYTKTTD